MKDPDFYQFSRSAIFLKTSDFNKISVFKSDDSSCRVLKAINPHKRHSVNWSVFEDFRKQYTFQAAGAWPDRTLFTKSEIAFEYFLFARRVPVYHPLTETYSDDIVLDTEEGVLYCLTEH